MLPASKIPPLKTELHASNRILSPNAGSRVTLKGEGGHLEKKLCVIEGGHLETKLCVIGSDQIQAWL